MSNILKVCLPVFLLVGAPVTAFAQKGLTPEQVPTFQLRARIVSQVGKDVADKKFTIRLDGSAIPAVVTGGAWSGWLVYDKNAAAATLKGYPAIYMRGYPVVVRLSVSAVQDPTVVEAELKLDENGKIFKLNAELFGPRLGILLWRDNGEPKAATMAEYNRRYWQFLEGVTIRAEQRPKLFPIVDRFIGGDDDRIAWREGIEQLSKAGFSVIMLPPSRPIRDLLLKTGLSRTSWAVYSPPGYAFDFDPKITPESLDDWAAKQAKPYLDAGYAAKDMALFALSDEPGWYYPSSFEPLTKNPAALTRFRDYLKAQKLTPADVGANSWDAVLPLARSAAKELPARRLFYWTMRFYAHDSARHFAAATRALEKAFYPDLPVLTNWNFFAGRLYVPGPVANNRDKESPDAAMGGHDWFEFGRLRGGTMLWTEDWFGDGQAYQWSFYCARLRCAAEKSGVQFGGYVIPRTAGAREDGILQRILCVAGSGGKAIKYFVFGPEYNFPGNCYSERAKVLPKMAEAHRMIGMAEELLWHGTVPQPQVAILAPRSAQMWDAKDIPVPRKISDATNTNMNGNTVDYMAETFNLYLALQHANIPVDFVDEDDLVANGLKRYRVLYITEPNIPVEGQRQLIDWVKSGGTLVSVAGAGSRGRYDEPCTVLHDALGIHEQSRERLLIASTKSLPVVAEGTGKFGDFTALLRSELKASADGVIARFKDDNPAVVERSLGKGRAVHFAWMPGLSYWKSADSTKDGLPAGFSESIRKLIIHPVELAKVTAPVDVDLPFVETPMLLSEKGAAVTVLNWSGEPNSAVNVTVRLPFAARQVESVSQGPVKFSSDNGAIRFTIPLRAADIIMIRRY